MSKPKHGHAEVLGSKVNVAGIDNCSKKFSSKRRNYRTVTSVGVTWWEWGLFVSYILNLRSKQEGKSHKKG